MSVPAFSYDFKRSYQYLIPAHTSIYPKLCCNGVRVCVCVCVCVCVRVCEREKEAVPWLEGECVC